LIDHEASLEQIDALTFRETSKEKFLYANAARVFGFD
jgi:predicted TIM-barrel fold metal-dependent hydrolase